MTRSGRVGMPMIVGLRRARLVLPRESASWSPERRRLVLHHLTGTVTMELKQVPWDLALEQILEIHDLGMDFDGAVARIAPLEVLREEARRVP